MRSNRIKIAVNVAMVCVALAAITIVIFTALLAAFPGLIDLNSQQGSFQTDSIQHDGAGQQIEP